MKKELKFEIKEDEAQESRKSSTDEGNKQIPMFVEEEESVALVEKTEFEKPAEPLMSPEELLKSVKSYAETHKNTLEIEKTEESHVDNQVENEITPNEGENVIVKE